MGASNSNTGKNTKFYQLKAKADETNTPYFGLSEKGADGKWTITNKFDTMSGMLTSATIKEREYEGVKSKLFVLVLEDGEETSQIEMTHNMISHSIINSLASSVDSTYSIQLYKKQENGKWWGKVSVKNSGQKTNWKIDPKTAPKKEQVMMPDGNPFLQNGKPVYDDSKLRAFYEDLFIKDIASKLSPQGSVKQAETHSGVANSDAGQGTITSTANINLNDDLPF
jgi:hypothetical protein